MYGHVPHVVERSRVMTELSAIMEFDHVVTVHPDGTVTDGPDGLHAPSVYWADDGHHVDGAGWDLLTGYSGQYGYSGPIMHASEMIGGRLAADVLAEPGTYAAVVCYVMNDDEPDADDVAGWAIARHE